MNSRRARPSNASPCRNFSVANWSVSRHGLPLARGCKAFATGRQERKHESHRPVFWAPVERTGGDNRPHVRSHHPAPFVNKNEEFNGNCDSEDELSHLAAKARLPEKLVLDTARETVALFHQYWHAEKANLPLAAEVVQSVEAHVKTIPIA